MRLALAALALLSAAPALAAPPLPAPHVGRARPAPGGGAPAATPPAAPAAASLVLYPALGRPTQVTVAGRVLGAAGPGLPSPGGLPGAQVQVALGGQTRRVVSGADGLFEATFATAADRPSASGPRAVQARSGAAAAEGAVQVVDDDAPFLLVIEADDLLGLRAGRGGAGEDGAQAAAMAAFVRCVTVGTRPAAGAVAVTAGGDRAARLLEALAGGGFPFVGVVARPTAARGAPRVAPLRSILSDFPQRVVLLGDARGGSPERFAALRAEFPGRVVAAFVRGGAPGTADARLEEATFFTDPLLAARQAADRGLADRACVERAVSPPAPEQAAAAPGAQPAAPPACPACPCTCPAPAPDAAPDAR